MSPETTAHLGGPGQAKRVLLPHDQVTEDFGGADDGTANDMAVPVWLRIGTDLVRRARAWRKTECKFTCSTMSRSPVDRSPRP